MPFTAVSENDNNIGWNAATENDNNIGWNAATQNDNNIGWNAATENVKMVVHNGDVVLAIVCFCTSIQWDSNTPSLHITTNYARHYIYL